MGLLRGPFTGRQMQSWFEYGFFPMIMRLKSEFEPNFRSLGDYIALFGNQFFCLPSPIFLGSRMPPFHSFLPSYGTDMLPSPSWVPQPKMEREAEIICETTNDLSNLSLREEKPQDIKDVTTPTLPVLSENVNDHPSEPILASTLPISHEDPVEIPEPPKTEIGFTMAVEEKPKKSTEQPSKPDLLQHTDKVKPIKPIEPVSKTPDSSKDSAKVNTKSWNIVRPEAKVPSLAEIQRIQSEYQKVRKLAQQETANKAPGESKSAYSPPSPWTKHRHEDPLKPISLEQIQKEQEKEFLERAQHEKQLITESSEDKTIPAPVGWSKIVSSSSSSISSSKPRSFLDIQREQSDQSKLTSTPSATTMADVLRGVGRRVAGSKTIAPWTTPSVPQVSRFRLLRRASFVRPPRPSSFQIVNREGYEDRWALLT